MLALWGKRAAFARLEALLPPEGGLVFEEKPEPFGMVEGSGFWIGGEILEAFGHTVKTKGTQVIEGGRKELEAPSCAA